MEMNLNKSVFCDFLIFTREMAMIKNYVDFKNEKHNPDDAQFENIGHML